MTETVTNHCSICNDTGWKIVVKDGREFAQKCECQVMDGYIAKAKRANFPTRFIGAGLEWGYHPDKDNPEKAKSQAKAKEAAIKFINDYPSVEKGLLFQGTVGVGKTFIICSIGFELIKKLDVDVYYIDWNDLVREMRTGENYTTRDFESIQQLIQKLCSVKLLLFDELGSSKVSTWVYDNIYYLINRRYNEKKITVCATNFFDKPRDANDALIKRIGDRIRSRLYEMTNVVEIEGFDFRRRHLSGTLRR